MRGPKGIGGNDISENVAPFPVGNYLMDIKHRTGGLKHEEGCIENRERAW
jgi:hypothetical protein